MDGPSSSSQHFGLEVFIVGEWEDKVDFLAVVEHPLIPARVRGDWDRRGKKGLASVWAPANQDSSRVGNAGVGVVSMKGASLSLPTFATVSLGDPLTVVGL